VKLTYNGVALHELGSLVIASGPNVEFVGDDSAQRKRVTLSVRLHVFQSNFNSNRGLLNQAVLALRTQHGVLNWSEDSGAVYLNQTARVTAHDFPEDANAWGTHRQTLNLTLQWWEHDVTTNTLTAQFTPSSGAAVTLGNVLTHERGYTATRASILRAPRSTANGRISMTGVFLADTRQSLAQRRTDLQAKVDALYAAVNNASGRLVFGTFDQSTLHVDDFKASVNQPVDAIDWSLSATYPLVPGDTEAVATYEVAQRTAPEGITTTTISGTITARTRALADTKLATILSSLITPQDFRLEVEATERRIDSDVDGEALIEVGFSQTWQRIAADAASLIRTGFDSLNLGTVIRWNESITNQRDLALRDPRKMATGNVQAEGRFIPPEGMSEPERREWLSDRKEELMITCNGKDATLAHRAFARAVRIESAVCNLDAAADSAPWTITCVFSRYPVAGEVVASYDLQTRIEESGTRIINFSGSLLGDTQTICETKLNGLRGALFTTDYFRRSGDTTPRTIDGSDGAAFIEMSFSDTWQRKNPRTATIQRTGYSAISLGNVEKFAEGITNQRSNPLRPQRTIAGGKIAASGVFFATPGLTEEQAKDYLETKKNLVLTQCNGKDATVVYGAFNQLVRVEDFTCDIDEASLVARWSLTGSFTRFPNEADYLLVEFEVRTNQDQATGNVTLNLSGRIGAGNRAAADVKLAALRAAYAPSATWAVDRREATDQRVDADTDGAAWIELRFNEEYRQRSGDIIEWTLTRSDNTDATAGTLMTVFSGTVVARGANYETAKDAAVAFARTLGDQKYQFKLRESITPEDHHDLAQLGERQVRITFSFEYRRKGTRIYGEVAMETQHEVAGVDVDNVSGYFTAVDYATAIAQVNAVKATYATGLIRNERTTQGTVNIDAAGSPVVNGTGETDTLGLVRQFVRVDFAFAAHRVKSASQTGFRYSLDTETDYVELISKTTLSGVVVATTRAAAAAAVDVLITALGIGTVRMKKLQSEHEIGAFQTGAERSAFLTLNFSVTSEARLTGTNALRECEVSEEVEHSGTRWIARATAAGRDVMQDCGIQSGRRTVSGSVKAATEALCTTWINQQRTLLTGTYELPPVITTGFAFEPVTVGVARGTGLNARLITKTFRFVEILPDNDYA
jgi:hypothetical protein